MLATQEVLTPDPAVGMKEVNSSSYIQFIESIKTEATRTDYLKGLKYFMEFCRITPGDYDSLLQNNDSKIIQSRIIDFIIYCKNVRELSPASIDSYIAAIKKFYIQNDILTINWKKINSYKPEFQNVVDNDQAYTKEQIQMMLSMCSDLRDKAILLLLASTGMRIGAVPRLRLNDLQTVDGKSFPHIGDTYIFQVTVYRKSKQQYICYTTFEAHDAISAYLEYRSRCGEILTPESFLFRKVFDKRSPLEISTPKPITVTVINWILLQLLDSTGIRQRQKILKGQHNIPKTHLQMSHAFRKWVISNFIRAKLEYGARERLVGHKVSRGLDTSYDRRPEEEILAEYCKAIPYLTIGREAQLQQQITEMEQVNKDAIEELRTELEWLKGRAVMK
jgi:integrase